MPALKDRTQIQAENASTLHFVLTPFRMLREFLYALGVIGMAVGFIFINQTGWIVDLGARSGRSRQAVVEYMSTGIGIDRSDHAHLPMIDITVDFTNRAGGTNSNELHFPGDEKTPSGWPDHFWISEPSDYYAGFNSEPYTTLTPFILDTDRADMALRGFPYCHTGNPRLFDTKLPPWGDREDPDILVNRKSGRMRRDYETAAIMVSALRSALAHMKAGQSLASEYGPASGKPLGNSYCNADGADPALLNPAQITAYRAVTFDIHLEDAPRVKFRYIRISPDYGHGTTEEENTYEHQWREAGMQIVGMCVAGMWQACPNNGGDEDNGLMPYTTYWADLWATNPPLSPNQMEAERELLKTATWDFWAKEAQANEVTDLAPLKAEFDAAQHDLAAIFGDGNTGISVMEPWLVAGLVLILMALVAGIAARKSSTPHPGTKKMKATDALVRSLLEGLIPAEEVLKELETSYEEIDASRMSAGFNSRFGSCATYADVVRQCRDEREARRKRARVEASKYQALFDQFSSLVATCSPAWDEMRRTAGALYGVRIGANFWEALKSDTINVIRAFAAANGEFSRPLRQLYVAVSKIWGKRRPINSRFEEIDISEGDEIRLPVIIQGLQSMDSLNGTSHCREWAAAFWSLISSADACCPNSVAATATKQRFHSLLEPYLHKSGSGEQAGDSRAGNEPPAGVASAQCSECARAYDLLELPYGCDRAQVVQARRELAKKFHPDAWGQQRGSRAAEEQLKRVNAACDHLIRCQALS